MQIDVEKIRANGVVGAGGAGFPAYVKMQAKGVDTVIVNAAECEPLLHKDKELLKKHATELMEVLGAIVRHLGAQRGIVGIKQKYEDVIELLKQAATPGLTVHPLQDFYPAGDEFNLVYETTGRVIPPGQIPLSVKAVVSNVETLLNVAWDRPVTHKYLTVAGAVERPITLRVPIGVTIGECIAMAGKPTCEGQFAVIDGGVMMGKLVTDLHKPVTRTTGGLIVVPADHDLVRRRTRSQVTIDQIGRSACDQCSFCTELCPRFLLGHPIEPHLAMRNLGFHEVGDRMILGTSFCCECNLCTLYSCPEDLDPKNACVQSKITLKTKGLSWPKEDLAKRNEPHPMEKYRHIPVKKLMLKLGLSNYQNVGPLIPETVEPKSLRILLSQHVGTPATPVVKAGDHVKAGQELGSVPKDKLGVPIHAPLAGVVRAVEPDAIVLDVKEN